MFERRRLLDEGAKRTFAEPADGRGFHRFGREHIIVADGQAQKVPCEKEAGDLAATIREEFVDPQRTRRDAEHMGRRIAFPCQDGSCFQGDDLGHVAKALEIGRVHSPADGQGARAATVAVVALWSIDTSGRRM